MAAVPAPAATLCAAPQFFPSASGFEIKGPIFNSHIYPSPIGEPSNGHTTPSSSMLDSSPNQISIPYVESEVYAKMLLLRKKGYPLWKPKSENPRLPEAYRREGVHIGDVGILTESGGFDYLFNVCHGSGHELNLGRVPEGFKPISNLDCDDTEDYTEEYEMGCHVSSDPNHIHRGRIQTVNTHRESLDRLQGVPEEVGEGLSYWSTTSRGALLILPEGGKSVNHLSRARFEKYAAEFAASWYTHVIGTLGREIHNGSLYLVTGFDKARAWGVASFSNAEPENVSLEFVPKSSNGKTRYPKYWFRTCNSAASSSGADDTYGRQSGCVFLRGLKIAIRERWFREKVMEITRISNLDADCLFPKAPIGNEGGWSYSSQRWFNSFRQDPLLPSKRSLLADSDTNECYRRYIILRTQSTIGFCKVMIRWTLP
ncbi:hypothetical protein DFJ43DRAFT_1160796 [Lentinula guzmanii]|uniref:Uncharacterized protein n=1 Tax=Lentinula guzmanii TaxID=2804957 RepID=A0AA38J2P3_9AGAR|nr:hypothetical protein DFJ43DRAFT_1160796 [Lentinula guzmanii]